MAADDLTMTGNVPTACAQRKPSEGRKGRERIEKEKQRVERGADGMAASQITVQPLKHYQRHTFQRPAPGLKVGLQRRFTI